MIEKGDHQPDNPIGAERFLKMRLDLEAGTPLTDEVRSAQSAILIAKELGYEMEDRGEVTEVAGAIITKTTAAMRKDGLNTRQISVRMGDYLTEEEALLVLAGYGKWRTDPT